MLFFLHFIKVKQFVIFFSATHPRALVFNLKQFETFPDDFNLNPSVLKNKYL